MSGTRHTRISRLFEQACELRVSERATFLETACAGDAELRSEVETLLAADERAAVRFGTAAIGRTRDGGGVPASAEPIGPYRVLGLLGEGGMGIVYLAEQQEPIHRRVALKIIKHGMDTKQVIARFEAERQALAMMDHPNVAKVFDAGATERGRPYFAMEYVKGVPITEHCDRQRLTTRERLELFVQVCAGVQHAHQKAIIHRDLKPSNVLVSYRNGDATPKIIDFGVAKATVQRLTEKTLYTEMGVLIGTPEYMSPEQAEMTGQDVDTRTDVYSLGVVLYEMLVGALPFESRELRQAGFDEIRRRIREEEPARPSTRLSSLDGERSKESANSRRTDAAILRRQLLGDLDWITMKALAKDRARRYGSPAELAADVVRHLGSQPVLARPPSAVYRARKFVRRHVVGVGAAALVSGVVIAFAVTTTVQSRRIAQEAETAERVSEFLADMLGDVDPQVLGMALWRDLRERAAEVRRSRDAPEEEIEAVVASLEDTLAGVNPTDAALKLVDEQILARAGETIEQELAAEPLIAARLEQTIGDTYRRLGLYARAEPHAMRAVEIRTRELGEEHTETLHSSGRLAWLYYRQGRLDLAEPLYVRTLAAQRRILGAHPDTLTTMTNLGNLLYHRNRFEEAEALQREAIEARSRVLGPDHPDTLTSMNGLANALAGQERHDESRQLELDILEVRRRVLGTDHRDTLVSMSNLASSYRQRGDYEKAERLQRETLESQLRVLGTEHSETLGSMASLADIYVLQGRKAEAEAQYRSVLEIQRRALGSNHPNTLDSIQALEQVLESRSRQGDAK